MASNVSAHLERLRKANKRGYRELAAFLDVPLSQAHAWATGGQDPNLQSLKRIAKKLKTSIAEMVS